LFKARRSPTPLPNLVTIAVPEDDLATVKGGALPALPWEIRMQRMAEANAESFFTTEATTALEWSRVTVPTEAVEKVLLLAAQENDDFK
jgi:hypothetical protein